jgi:hypothetical protein
LIANIEVEKLAELKYQSTKIKISQFFLVKKFITGIHVDDFKRYATLTHSLDKT